jgi:hypothetical protein
LTQQEGFACVSRRQSLWHAFYESAVDTDEKFASAMESLVREIGDRGKIDSTAQLLAEGVCIDSIFLGGNSHLARHARDEHHRTFEHKGLGSAGVPPKAVSAPGFEPAPEPAPTQAQAPGPAHARPTATAQSSPALTRDPQQQQQQQGSNPAAATSQVSSAGMAMTAASTTGGGGGGASLSEVAAFFEMIETKFEARLDAKDAKIDQQRKVRTRKKRSLLRHSSLWELRNDRLPREARDKRKENPQTKKGRPLSVFVQEMEAKMEGQRKEMEAKLATFTAAPPPAVAEEELSELQLMIIQTSRHQLARTFSFMYKRLLSFTQTACDFCFVVAWIGTLQARLERLHQASMLTDEVRAHYSQQRLRRPRHSFVAAFTI